MSQTALLQRAEKIFVGGSNGEFRLPPEANLVVSHGKGVTIYDISGKAYTDFLLGSGPMILGHGHPEVVERVSRQITQGTTFMALNEPAIRLAERVVDASPCGEKIRLVVTGSEAVQFALRAARAFTGRDRFLRFEGGWHGVSDSVLHGARTLKPGTYPETVPDGGGIPRSWSTDVLATPFNDVEQVVKVVERYHREISAILIEPLQRCILPEPDFFEVIRNLATKYGIIIIFDEIVTGFRMAWGGAQERYKLTPDLAVYGKTISGGYPVAAICGRADVMEVMNGWRAADDPKRAIVSGTFNGYPVGAVAGLATLDVLERPGTYERFFAMGDRITQEIRTMGEQLSIPLLVGGEGPVLQILFTNEHEIVNYGSMFRADKHQAFVFGVEMIKRGVFVSPYEKIYLSLAHTDDDIDCFLGTAEEVLRDVISQMN